MSTSRQNSLMGYPREELGHPGMHAFSQAHDSTQLLLPLQELGHPMRKRA
jgi:hypothetical protein